MKLILASASPRRAEILRGFAPRMEEKLRESPILRDVASDQEVGGLCAQLVFDRKTAYRFGISPSTIDQTLYDAYGQREVSTIYTQLNQYHVVLEVDPDYRQNPLDLRDLYIRTNETNTVGSAGLVSGGSAATQLFGPTSSLTAATTSLSNSTASSSQSATIPSDNTFGGNQIPSTTQFPNGGQVPLAAFTHMSETNVPLTVNHQGQLPVVTLSFNLARRASLGDAIDAVNKIKAQSNMPPSIEASFQGTAASFLASLSNEPVLILAALVTVYIVLGVLYESYIHPITILSTLPSAGVGALLSLLICRVDFSVIALIGLVLLIGIVKKNGIMMIELCFGGGAQGRDDARERHLPGVLAAVSAHHDDHHGRAAGWRSIGARHRHGFRIAPARWESPWWADSS